MAKCIITRPEKQALHLKEKLDDKGIENQIFSTINIEPLEHELKTKKEFDCGIYISRNAVEHGHDLAEKCKNIAAIGLGTQEALECHDIVCDIFPEEPPFNSEALLELIEHEPFLTFLIIKGEEGRAHLKKKLEENDAEVTSVDVYRRTKPDFDQKTILETFQAGDVVISTSNEGLDNLIEILQSTRQIDLDSLQFLVISETMRKHAESLGIKHLHKADSARDEDVISALQGLGYDRGKTDDIIE